MDIISVALKRHSTKAFDASKKLTPEQAEQIKTLLQYSPSSTNSQPWHFIVASTEEGKARVAKSAADNYVFNERKMLDASHVVVFCAKTAMDDAWLKLVVDQEDADGRFATPEAKAANDKGRKFFADMHRKDLHDDAEWMAKQVYLNVGNFLLGVAALALIRELRRIFQTVLREDCFVQENVDSLGRMGNWSFFIAGMSVARCVVYMTVAMAVVILVFVIAGLFSKVLACVFREAVRYKLENDLTI